MNSNRKIILGAITLSALVSILVLLPANKAADEPPAARITLLYDAFGQPSQMKKDWGFSALIEYGGKRVLFDTGNNAEIFAHNVGVKNVDLTDLDFAIVSHRHGDHTSGLNHLLEVNPKVKVYAPQENFGVFGAALPGSFYKRNEASPPEMRYFDGKSKNTLKFGSPWPNANFEWVTNTTEVAPGFHLVMLHGTWGVDLEVRELSLAIDTPDGIVLVIGCGHPTLERIITAATEALRKPIHLVLGGLHLLPAKTNEIQSIANSLRDNRKVAYVAPAHCSGERAFAILKETFGDRYLFAGLGTTLKLGPVITAMTSTGEISTHAMGPEEFKNYRKISTGYHLRQLRKNIKRQAMAHHGFNQAGSH